MKIRIKGNSLRIRVSKSEVNKLATDGYLEERTSFGDHELVYSLQTINGATELSAELLVNKITMYVPASWASSWPTNDVTGVDAHMPLKANDSLYLLLEKDFVCLDATNEDQSDNYENPHKAC